MNPHFSTPIVYCISEGDATAQNFDQKKQDIVRKVRNASGFGIGLFQIREKALGGDLLFDLASAAVEAADNGIRILVNTRFDIALAAGAHGVHLPSDAMPVDRVRESVGRDLIIGVSAHSLDDVMDARSGGADFAVFAPVFESPGKIETQGLVKLREVSSAAAPFPVLALGGVDESNVDEVLAAGASGYAAIRYLNEMLQPDSKV